ncbi:uncharacterized protein LOC126972921 isoform X4 [Leptidea sinapis]|uniref:uncharacterized protein LOC126972921 isoform X1 n=2 Tax=Leptidea sinapis TaxID=189913 RepID=UPI0021C43BAC|nr:uncharacterized protein LOC126972921 isoform X1 [Leptidea sinapis]XP_050675979.1 uncharacterized protein LOC126972921 isoform X2 [Leptidea sinapis]XP_050675981.1 uncharacterized protein LOC126972921 isoform X3 [Leptidea sinapis]XP_050675982.1 uncharacterized protein LOC126972921 isoform X4 [Leptidea sinapis]
MATRRKVEVEGDEQDIRHRVCTHNAVKQRLFSQVQKLYDTSLKICSNPESVDIDMFLLRASEINSIREKYEKVTINIFELEVLLNPKIQFNSSELDSFDDLFFQIKSCVKNLDLKTENNSSDNSSKTEINSRPRLPKLELISFDGNIENFTTFYETFCSLVHNQKGISNIDKFHYLLSCVKGSALSVIKSVPITSSNYDVVWKALLDKYQDQRMVASKYLDKMLTFPPILKESPLSLNNFIEIFENSYKAICSLNIPNLHSYVICHIALKSLDQNTRKLFEQSIDQTTIPCYENLISFVQNHVKVLEHSQTYTSNIIIQNNGTQRNKQHLNLNTNNNKNLTSRKNYTQTTNNKNKLNNYACLHCNENHMIFRCTKFRKLTPTQRISRANTLGICHNCLKLNHTADECRSEFRCYTCGQTHHALLHVDYNSSAPAAAGRHPLPAPPAPVDASIMHSRNDNCHSSLSDSKQYSVILGTAIVNVVDVFGIMRVVVRAPISDDTSRAWVDKRTETIDLCSGVVDSTTYVNRVYPE